MPLPDVVSEEEWRAARIDVLREEKALTRAHDALNTKRREMPMVEVTKAYTFEGPDGAASLLDLFEDRLQLIVFHFMFDPEWDDGCPSCTAGADEIADGLLEENDSHIRVLGAGILIIRNIAMAFDAYLEQMMREKPVFSKTV